MQTYFQEGLDNQLNGQVVCLDGFVSVILLQKLTHGLGAPAYSISLKEECVLRCGARQSRTGPRTRPQLPGPAVSEAAWPLGPALWTPFPKSYLELVLILSHEWDSPLLLKDTGDCASCHIPPLLPILGHGLKQQSNDSFALSAGTSQNKRVVRTRARAPAEHGLLTPAGDPVPSSGLCNFLLARPPEDPLFCQGLTFQAWYVPEGSV